MKARKLFAIISFLFLSLSTAMGQPPTWRATTPSVASTGALSITLNYGINMTGTVYICVFNFDNTTALTSAQVKGGALAGPAGGRVATAVLPVAAGQVNTILQATLNVLNINTLHSVFLVAERSSGVLQVAPVKLFATTLPCPSLGILTGFLQPQVCVNKGATATFVVVLSDPNPNINGILKGTQWVIDWGDGTIVNYTSVADNDIPSLALRQHTYLNVTDCNYVFSNSVQNPCLKTRAVQYVAVVHGRDIPSDGDGILQLVNNANGNTVIQVCAGTQTIITIRDNSTWNCQNPILPGGLTAEPNTDPREIEWLYGRDPLGAITNTITGAVNIATLGAAPRASGRFSPTPYGPASLSQAITIPATCLAGQYFRVYLKNWNKCNWLAAEYVSTFVDILVIGAPPAPTVANKTICFGGNSTLTVTSPVVGTIYWYSDAGLTTQVGTGVSHTPAQTAVGTYNRWVVDRSLTGLLCQSPSTLVTLTINAIPNKPGITVTGSLSFCFDGATSVTLTANPNTPPVVSSYQWYKDAGAFNTNLSNTFNQIIHSGTYTLQVYGIAPTSCPSPLSDPVAITIGNPATVNAGIDRTICSQNNVALAGSIGGGAGSATWSGGAGTYNPNNTTLNAIYSPSAAERTAGSVTLTLTTNNPAGPCNAVSDNILITINPTATVNAGPDQTICSTTATVTLAGTRGGGSSSAAWSGGAGTFAPNNTTLNAVYTPTAAERTAGTVTLTLTTNDPAGPCIAVSDNMIITINQAAIVNAGSDQIICSDGTATLAGTRGGGSSSTTWSGGTGTYAPNNTTLNAVYTPSAGDIAGGTLTLTLTTNDPAGPCGAVSDAMVITFNAAATVNAGPDQSICAAASATLTGVRGGSATSATWSGGGGAYAPNNTTLNAVYTPSAAEQIAGTVTLTLTTNNPAGPCNAVSDNVIIIIGSSPTSATLTGSGDICVGAASSTIRSVITSGTPPYDLIITGYGVYNNYSSGTDINLGVLGAGAHTYTLTSVTDDCSNSLGTMPGSYTINVYSIPVAAAGPDQSVCGSLVTALAAVPTVGTGTWTKTSGPGTVTFSNVNNATSNATVSAYGTYMLRWTEVNGGICSSFDEITIVYAEAANAGPDQQKCVTLVATLAGNLPTVGAGAWTKISGPGTVNFSNATSPTSTATVSLYGTYVLRWTITNGSCNTFDEVEIAYAEIANAGLNQTYCGTLIATLAGNSPSSGTGAWTKISGPGTVTFSNTANPTSTATVSLYGIYVLRWTITNGSCNTSDDVQISFAETSDAGLDQQICGSLVATFAANTPSSGNGIWVKLSGPGTVIFSNLNSATSTATVSLYGTYIFRWVIVNGSCTTFDQVTIAYAEEANVGPDQQKCGTLVATLTGNTASAGVRAWTKISGPGTVNFSNATSPISTATVSLYGTYVLRWTITNGSCNTFDEVTIDYAEAANAGPDQKLCSTLIATLAGNAASAGAGAWIMISGPGTVNFSNAAIETSTATVSLYGTYVLRWTITNGSCNTFDEVTVSYEMAANAGPAQDLCNVLATALAGNTPAVGTGTWTLVSGPGTVVFTPTVNTAAATATVSVYGTYIFKWTIDNSGVCSTNQNVTINYNPAGQVDQPANQVLCNNTGTSAVNFTTTNTIGATTYSWTNSVPGIGLAASGSGNIASFIAVNAGTAPVVATIVVTPTLINGSANCAGPTKTFTITVKPTPTLSGTLTPADVCSNTAFSYNPASGTAGTTFNWTRAIVAGITPVGTTSGSNNPNETLVNVTSAPIAVTYQYTLTANGCSNIQNVVVNIKSEPKGGAATTTTCSDVAVGYNLQTSDVNVLGNSQPSNFSWVATANPNVTGESTIAQAGTIITDVINNVTNVVQTVIYTVTPTGTNGCTGSPFTVTVSIGAEPILDAGLNKFACNNEVIGLLLKEAIGSIAASYYNIISVTVDAGLTPNAGNATIPDATAPAAFLLNDKYTNTTTGNLTVTYRVQPVVAPNCFGNPVDVVITIHPPILGGAITGNTSICYNTNAPNIPNAILASGGDGAITYSWYYTENMAAVPGDVNWTLIPGATLSGYDPGVLINPTKFVRKAKDGSCIDEVYTNMITININPLPLTSAISGPALLCMGATNKVYQVANTPGSSYTWTLPASITLNSPQGLFFIIVDAAAVSLPGEKITVVETFFATTHCVGLPVDLPVTVSPIIPGVVVTGPLQVCQSDAGVIYSVPDHALSTYSWIVPVGAAITTDPTKNQISVTFNMVTTGPVSVVETTGALCTTVHIPISVTVNPLPTVYNLTAPAAYCTGDPGVTITLSDSQTGVNYQLYKNLVVDGVPVAGNTGSALTWTNKLADSYTVVATNVATTCKAPMNGTVVITINLIVSGSIGTDQTICEGDIPSVLTNVASATGGGSISYQWQNSTDNITYTNIIGATSAAYSSPSLTADIWFIRKAVSTLGSSVCSASSAAIKVTVNNFVPGSISTDQTICDGVVPAAFISVTPTGDGTFTYQWKQSTDGLIFTDIGGATSETYSSGALTVDIWYKREVNSTLNGKSCVKETNILKVTVINFTPGSISTDQTICNATAPAAFTSVAASGDGVKTYQWQSSPDNSTWTNIGGALSATYTAGVLVADTYYRRLSTSTLNLTACTLPTNSILVTVNNFVPGSIAADQTICEGDSPVAFTSVTPTGDGTFTYQWQNSLDGVSFSNITGATSETFGAGILIQDTWYKRLVTSTLLGVPCVQATNTVRVTVVNFTTGSISASQTICEGSTPVALTATAPAGDGAFTFQWQSSIDGATFGDIAGATLATYAPGVLIADTWYKRVVTSTLNLIPCIKETNVIKVTVNNFVAGSIATDQTICEGSAPAALTSVTPTGDGVFTYKWYNSTDGAIFALIPGAVSETYSPSALTVDTWYKREVTSTLSGNSCIKETNIVKVTVNNLTAGPISADQTICEGATPAAFTSVAATGDGTITYQWKDSPDGIVFTDIAAAIGATYAPGALTQDTWYKRVVTSNLPGKDCILESNLVRVTVINFIPGSISTDQTICNATAPAAFTSVAASGDGVKTYQWQSSPDNSTWTNIGGATSATYTAGVLAADTYYRRIVTSTLNGTPCTAPTNVILVTVNNFAPGSIAADQTICDGSIPATFTSVTPTGDGTITYQWQSSPDGVSFVNITGATSETFGAGILIQDTWYKRLVTSTLNGNTCTLPTNTVTVTVVNFNPGSISASQTICEGSTPVAFTATAPTGDGAFTFQWQSSIDGATFGDIAGATLATYAPGVLIADTWYKRVVTSTLNLIPCIKETNVIKVTVNNFVPGSISADETICENTAPAPFSGVSPTGDGVLSYKWQSSTDNITYADIPGAIGETYNAGILAVDTWFKRQVTSTIGGNSCMKETNIIKVTVINFNVGSIAVDQTICDGGTPAAFTSVTPTGDGLFSYQWRNSLDGVVFNDIAGAISETYTPGALTQDTWYKRVVTSTLPGKNCVKETNLVRVTVINFAPGSIGSDQTICESTVPATFTSVAASGDGVFTYQWQDSPDGITYTNILGANSATYTAAALIADTYFKRIVTATLNGKTCVQPTNFVLVTVNNFVPGTISADQTICDVSAPVAFTSVTPVGDGIFTFQWQVSLDGVSFSNILGATSETFGAGTLIQDTWYRRQVTSALNGNNCTKATNAVRITVVNFNAGTISVSQTICEGTAPAAFTSVAPSGDGAFTFQWQSSIDGTTFGDIAGATLATYAPGVLIADTWYKRVVISTLNLIPCIKETNVIKVTVNNFIPGSIAADQTICDGTAPAPFPSVSPTGDGAFTFQWRNSIDNVTYNDIIGAVSETYNAGILTADTWYKRQVTSTLSGNSCMKETNFIKVTVINFVPGSITADQTICEGGTPSPFAGVAPTGDGVFSYQWKDSPDGIVFTDIAAATGATYAPGALTQDTWYKRVVTATVLGVPCIKETNQVRVTLVNFVPGSIGSDHTICESTVPATFTSAAPSGDGVFTYQWQDSPDGITFTNIAGANSAAYTSVALTADTWFRRVVTSTLNSVPCVKTTNIIAVTVNNFNPGTIATDQTICDGSAPAAFTSVTPAGDGTFTYQWQSSLDGLSFVNIIAATSETYGAGVLTQDTWYRRQVTSTLNGNTCTLATNVVRVTVVNFNAGTISAAQTICEGTAPAAFISVAPTGDGTFTFQWQDSPDGITFTNIGGATLATYAPGVLIADTWYKRVVTSTLNLVLCVKETNIIKVTVNNFIPGSIAADQTICDGSAPAPFPSVSPTGDGSFTFQWRSSIDNVTYNDIIGAVSETYNAGILTADTWYKRQVTSTLSGNSCMKETNFIKVTVINFVPGSITADQTICEGGVPAGFASITPTGDGVFTYQWRNSLDGVVFNNIAGATSETFTPPALTTDTWYKRVVTSTLNGTPCVKETNMVRVTVINFVPGSIGSNQTICEASVPATFTSVAPSGDGVFSYQWQDSPDGITFTNLAGASSASYTAVALSTDTWYRRIVTSTLNSTSCTAITNIVKVTINILAPGISTADQTICEGGIPLTFNSTAPTGSGTFTYQWQSSLDGLTFSNITGATAANYTAGALVQDTWYWLSVTSTLNGTPCTEMTNTVKVTVVNFNAGTISAAQTICEGSAPAAFTNVAPTGDGTFTFQWQDSPDGITFTNIGGANLATYAPGVLIADTWYKRVVTSTLNAIPCMKETNVIKVTVNNFIPGSISANETICEGSFPIGFTSVTPTGDGVFTYQWQSSIDGTVFSDITGAIFETYNSGVLTQDTWFKRKVTSTIGINSCTKETNVILVTVNNFVPGSISTDQTICEGGIPAAFMSVTPAGDGTFTYQWRRSADGLNFVDIAGATSETYTAGALTQDTWYKRVVTSTLSGVTCTKETNSVRVTVNNVQGGTIISDQTICSGSDPVSFMTIVNGSGDGVFTFQWQISTDGVIFTDIAGANSLNYDAPALTADTWYKRITKSVLNTVECTKESNVVKITINAVTGGIITAAQTICYGTAPAPVTSTDNGTGTGVITYQWQQSDNNITFINIPGATTFGYAPAALISDKYYKRILISILNGIVCTAESNVIKMTVNPLPVAMLSGGATICPASTTNLVVTMPVGTGPFQVDIENYPGVTIPAYVSGTNIPVTPAVTTTYKLLRVRDANGCEVLFPSANLNGTATVIVSTSPVIATFTPSPAVCEFALATYKVTANGTNPAYQWQVNTGTGFADVTDGGTYFGATTPTLQIFNSIRDMNGYIYHVKVSGCGTDVYSADAIFTVNTAAELTVHPSDSTVCLGNNAVMKADATGTTVTWQWWVNKGAGFVVITPDANFSGETTKTLTITNALGTFNNWFFRAKAIGTCGVPAYTNFARLSVTTPPSAGLQPIAKVICENSSATFIGNGSGYSGLKWEVSTNSGTTWTPITDDAIYGGSATNQLSILNAPVTLSGYQYKLGLIGTCTTTYTNAVTLTVNPNPVVNFAADINACGGVPVVLNGNPSGGTAPYAQHRWTGDVGPLSSYTVQSPTFSSLISGTYNLNYKVTDNKGCTANDDLAVIVDSPSADFNQDISNGCTPLTVGFTKDMTGISKFWWDFNDGSPKDSVNANPVHNFINTNASSIEYHNVKLTVRSPGGCIKTYTSMITVYPAIDATFTANTNIVCSGNPIVFTALSGASKYFWEYGDGASGYATNISNHLYTNLTTAPLVLTVKLTTTSFYSCSNVSTITITVMPVPLPQFTAVPVSQVYNPAGNPVTFTNTTNPGTWTWLWKFGDGATSTVQDPTHTYTALGDYKVTLVVNNANCKDSISHQVRVTPLSPVANFDSIPSGCEPLSIAINNTSLNTNTPGTTYRWDFGDGSISTAKNPTYTYFDPGTYRVELTVTGPGGIAVYSQVVNSYPSPKAYFEVTPAFVFVNDEKVRCFNLSEPITNSYLWEFGDGDTSKVKEPFHKYMTSGVFDITLWAFSANGCSDKYILSPGVTVEPAGQIRFSTVFTPNLDGPIEMDHLPTSGTEIDQFFFPPIREKVINYRLQIFNRLGVLIYENRDINIPWNGYYKGKLCAQGVYIWYVEGKYANGTPFKKVGDVTLLH